MDQLMRQHDLRRFVDETYEFVPYQHRHLGVILDERSRWAAGPGIRPTHRLTRRVVSVGVRLDVDGLAGGFQSIEEGSPRSGGRKHEEVPNDFVLERPVPSDAENSRRRERLGPHQDRTGSRRDSPSVRRQIGHADPWQAVHEDGGGSLDQEVRSRARAECKIA